MYIVTLSLKTLTVNIYLDNLELFTATLKNFNCGSFTNRLQHPLTGVLQLTGELQVGWKCATCFPHISPIGLILLIWGYLKDSLSVTLVIEILKTRIKYS